MAETKSKLADLVIDVRGVLCPIPVIETKKVADAHPNQSIETIVDNEVSRDNVKKFGESRQYMTSVYQVGKDYHIVLVPGANTVHVDVPGITGDAIVGMTTGENIYNMGGRVILMTKDYLGEGSEELGRTLMKTFWLCMTESDVKPTTIYFINSSVKMVINDSVHIENLKLLAEQGVEIVACGICLDYFGIKEQVGVGSITNMYAITDAIVGQDLVKL